MAKSNGCGLCGGMKRRANPAPVAICGSCGTSVCTKHVRYISDGNRQLCARCLRSEPVEVRQAAIAMVG
jgi:hypothetical protein